MVNSDMVNPTFTYPVFERIGDSFRIYPTLTTGYTAELFFIRKPKEPKWTYTNVQGNPVYSASSPDLQNFELHPSNFNSLVIKILLYCGISIREAEIENVANSEEMKAYQKQNS
jgi:hypothetical protein